MELRDIKINHIKEPLGFMMQDTPVLSYKVENAAGKRQKSVRIAVFSDPGMNTVLYDSGDILEAAAVYPLPLALAPRTRYHITVTVQSDAGEAATGTTWFETGKRDEAWQAGWITPAHTDDNAVPVLGKAFHIEKEVAEARLYVGCAGLYELELNGSRVGDEHLTPYCNDYSAWMQVITHDLAGCLAPGENRLEATLADGWYKGRFGLENHSNIYGDTLALIAELHLRYTDGSTAVIGTDETWYSRKSPYASAEIYDGVALDYRRDCSGFSAAVKVGLDEHKLTDRLSVPVVIKQTQPVAAVITTPKGEMCLDMGQNMVGWLRIDTARFPEKDFTLRHFEVLDPEGNVYLDNLRSARQAFEYKSDGKARLIEPSFTFYGFRYVWVQGLEDLPADAFTGCVVYSDMEQTGTLTTSNPLVNRLFLNALWGQRGNFVDVPTDCPQRDERLGWTGDAQVFCGTASFNMDATAFFAKYMYDVWQEQQANDGGVPHVVPSFSDRGGDNPIISSSAAAWGDVATVLPWTLWTHTGDSYLLARQYPAMKAWVEYIRRQDIAGHDLWDTGFHFGDWLALDTPRPELPLGTTPNALVASAYYLYSAALVAKAAEVLGYQDDALEYGALAERIRAAMQKEFITPAGRVASDTQTANVIALFMDFATDKARAAADLNEKVMANDGHLNTGFVGTAYLCRVLSDNGYNDTAYRLLMNKTYPSWLYEVEMGATTIWERWNSIKPDGSLGDVGMNSYNHYAYGAVMEWMYRNAAGLQPLEAGAGFAHIKLAPQPNQRLEWLKVSYDSPHGLYRSEWSITEEHLHFEFEIPFGCEASLYLPDAPGEIMLNGKAVPYQAGMPLDKGVYTVKYAPLQPYYVCYGLQSPAADVLANTQAMEWMRTNVPAFNNLPPFVFFLPAQGSFEKFLANNGIVLDAGAITKMDQDWKILRSWDVQA